MTSLSFHSVSEQKIQSISNNVIKDLYSKFCFLSFSLKKFNKQEIINNQSSIENLLFYSLKDYKFITVNLVKINQNKRNSSNNNNNSNKNNSILGNEESATDINAYFCAEDKFLIIKHINISIIKSLISRLRKDKIEILNVSQNFNLFENALDEEDVKEEISNFLQNCGTNFRKNKFINATIPPIISYTIRRFFYPSYYFKDPSFFNLYDDYKSKEENIKTKLFNLLFSHHNDVNFVYNFSKIIQEINLNIKKMQENKKDIIEFNDEDFIKLRKIYCNEIAAYFLVIHRQSFYIFLMKELINLNEPKYEISFCQKYYNRCFTRFYGFIKQRKLIKSIIYEYLGNFTLNQYKDKIDPIFSLLTINRLFQGINFLYSNNLIHRDLKPNNIILDNNFIPYISDFETIRHPVKEEQTTSDIGSIFYSSPEQNYGENVSFPTDIYSFGLIMYFIDKKKDFYSSNHSNEYLNKTENKDSLKSKNIQNLYMQCINTSPEKRPKHNDIKSSILIEINNFDYFSLSKEADICKKIELISLIFENLFIQYESKEEFTKWVCHILKFYFNSHISQYNYNNNDLKQNNSNELLNQGNLYLKRNNYIKARKYFELAAKQSNSEALCNLGIMYSAGQGLKQNFLKAKEYFELAAKQSNSDAFLNLGFMYHYGKGVKQSFQKAKEYFELAAKKNNSEALYNLGIYYSAGKGVEQNYLKAKEYYELAAKQNNSNALLSLGLIYYNGICGERDYLKAKEYFELAAKQNNSDAILSIGNLYHFGQGVKQDFEISMKYYELAAKQNNPNAFLNLGILYHHGEGVKKDYEKAKKYYELAAAQNNSDAFHNLGNLYFHGHGVKQDFSKAKELFELAVKHGNLDALYDLGHLYYHGQGVTKDYKKAKEYFELSAKLNNSNALLYLGNLYYNGQGVFKDYKKAKELFELSAKHNNLNALLKLGNLYLEGKGVKPDYLMAKKYYELLAKQNYSEGINNLGYLYLEGKGVKQDYTMAKNYFELSAMQGNSKALLCLGNLYFHGQGVEQSYLKAKKYYELSAKQNNSDAIHNLGNLYNCGQGVQKDINKAKELYEIAAKQNNPHSFLQLGIIYEKGNVCPKDFLRAKKLYEMAAEQNNSLAYIRLAMLYRNGNGVSQDFQKMKEYIVKAVDLRNSSAIVLLGDAYFHGIGVEKDYIEAKKYYEKASNQNNSVAFLRLGKLYYQGNGVDKDFIKAKKYYEYSAQLKNTEALFALGYFYSIGEPYGIDISKSIQYLKECKKSRVEVRKICTPEDSISYFQDEYNFFYYRAMNDLGLIYLITHKNTEKAIKNIKKAACAEYPFAQNNYGLLSQFYLNDLLNAEYFYKKSSKHQFALAEYNLGYIKEKEGKNKEAFKYYKQASINEDAPLEFHQNVHLDIRLHISKMFIICYTNIKLIVYYFMKSKIDKCKKYFIKAFIKILDLKNVYIQNQIEHIMKNNGNFISFLKFIIFMHPSFNLLNQPNLIPNAELENIIDQSNISLDIVNEEKDESFAYKNSIENSKDINFNDILERKYFNNKLINKNINYTDDKKYKLQEGIDNQENNDHQKDPNKSKFILGDLGKLFDYIEKDCNFLSEMNGIIETMTKILYKPPYNILFGRLSIERPKLASKEESNLSINIGWLLSLYLCSEIIKIK